MVFLARIDPVNKLYRRFRMLRRYGNISSATIIDGISAILGRAD